MNASFFFVVLTIVTSLDAGPFDSRVDTLAQGRRQAAHAGERRVAALDHVSIEQAIAGAAQEPALRAKDAYARAIELESQGNSSAALSLLWEAAGLAPRDADVQNRLGEALERMGALEAAIDAFRRANGAVTLIT